MRKLPSERVNLERRVNDCPTEEVEQTHLFRWTEVWAKQVPELLLLHAIPNGGLRSKSEAARMKAAGVKAGVPDLFLPVARGGSHGLYIELKRRKGGRVSPEQVEWMDAWAAKATAAPWPKAGRWRLG